MAPVLAAQLGATVHPPPTGHGSPVWGRSQLGVRTVLPAHLSPAHLAIMGQRDF